MHRKAALPPISKAMSLVFWEADILGLGKVSTEAEYEGEASEIYEELLGAKLDKQKTTDFLVRTFTHWGYDLEKIRFRDWENLGDAIAWLYNNDSWELA